MKALARLWRRLPGTAKVGVVLLGVFILIAIIGPEVTPYDPSVTDPAAGGRAVRRRTCSAPRKPVRTCYPSC